MFASAVYRECAESLGSISGMELTMLTVDEWRMNGRAMPFDPIDVSSSFATVVGKAAWRGYENRGFYLSGIHRAFQLARPEVLFLMEEPFSVFAAEILLAKSIFAPKIPAIFFTWNNLSRIDFDYRPSFFYRNVARQTIQSMDFALTANSDGIQVLREAGFRKPIRTIGYGVDTKSYHTPSMEQVNLLRNRLNFKPTDIVIGYVGRMLEMKGVDLLIEAFASLKRTHPDSLKLLLLGSGEAEQSLLDLARSKGIMEDVRHVHSVEHREVPNYMQTLDILVLPSRRVKMWAEQFGRVLVEAMAAGKIVVGSSSGAIPEVIGDGGFVFRENDSDDLTLKLEQALSLSRAERSTLLERAHARAAYYSWPRFAKDAFEALAFCVQSSFKTGGFKR